MLISECINVLKIKICIERNFNILPLSGIQLKFALRLQAVCFPGINVVCRIHNISHQFVEQRFYLLITAATFFGLSCRPSIESLLVFSTSFTQVDAYAADVENIKELPEDGHQLRSKCVGAVINK